MASNRHLLTSSSEDSDSDEADVFPAVDLREREIDREQAERAHMKAVKLAQESLEKSKAHLERFRLQAKREKELDQQHKALLRKKTEVDRASKTVRKPVLAPAANETVKGPPIVKGAKHMTVEKEPDELFAISANNIAKVVMARMVEMGVVDGPIVDTVEDADPELVPIALPLTRDQELEFVCLPETLRHEGFSNVDMSFPDLDGLQEENLNAENLPKIFKSIFDGLNAINSRVEQLVKTAQLHTLSHVTQIRGMNLTRQMCVADGMQKTAVYKKLQLAMKSVLLASDPDLAVIPFRTTVSIDDFFKSRERVVKLAHFLLSYVAFEKGYARSLLGTVVCTDLQSIAYWKSGTANNGVLPAGGIYLPRFFEMFLQQVARAAHRYVHIDDDESFNLARFNKEMRAALYNTERNTRKRAVNPSTTEHGEPRAEATKVASSRTSPPIDLTEGKSADEAGDVGAKLLSTKQAAADPQQVIDEEAETDVEYERKSSPKASGSKDLKRRLKPAENTPLPKRSHAMIASLYDHMLALADADSNVDTVIETLRSYAKHHGHRSGRKTACKHAVTLALALERSDGQEDWLAIVRRYKESLKKLPAGKV